MASFARKSALYRYLILSVLLMATSSAMSTAEVSSEPGLAAGSYIILDTDFGTSFTAYATGDENAEYGVLLIHDKWGLDQHVIQWADRFAGMGYRVVAVDLYDGRQVSNAQMAKDVLKSIDPVWIEADLKGALKYLKSRQHHIVSVGWGMGGEHALTLALEQPQDISAVITYYGKPVTDDQKLYTLRGPMLAVFADHDAHINYKTIKAFNESMAVLDKQLVEIQISAAQGFANPRSDTYSEQATEQAWNATKDFLDKYLMVSTKTN